MQSAKLFMEKRLPLLKPIPSGCRKQQYLYLLTAFVTALLSVPLFWSESNDTLMTGTHRISLPFSRDSFTESGFIDSHLFASGGI